MTGRDVAVVVLVVLGVLVLLPALGWLGTAPPAPTAGVGAAETPLAILKRRLASGEITREEYEVLKKEVTSS
jgi:uncharacterized membrane protein